MLEAWPQRWWKWGFERCAEIPWHQANRHTEEMMQPCPTFTPMMGVQFCFLTRFLPFPWHMSKGPEDKSLPALGLEPTKLWAKINLLSKPIVSDIASSDRKLILITLWRFTVTFPQSHDLNFKILANLSCKSYFLNLFPGLQCKMQKVNMVPSVYPTLMKSIFYSFISSGLWIHFTLVKNKDQMG